MDIAAIHRDIEGSSEDARFLAFMTLYGTSTEEATTEIERILELRDPILKLKFLRFLGHIPEERAVRYVCWLMEDENAVVAEAAQRAFERSSCETKLKLLLPLLSSPHPKVQCYAINKVGQAAWREALDPLLILLAAAPVGDADQERVLAILSALRFIPSPKSLDIVMPWIQSTHVELRFRAVMALGAIYELGVHRIRPILHRMLTDTEPRIRQAAVWGLRRHPSRRDLPWLLQLIANDPDSHVRQEAMLELGFSPTSRVIQHLLEVLEHETDRLVMLQCEAVLLKMDHTDLVKGLERIMRRKSGPARHRAMLMAAEFQRDSRRFYQFLVRGLQKSSTDKERLSFIEALGVLGNPDAVPILSQYLTASPLVAYVAMAALLKVNEDPNILIQFLENPQGGQLLKQMILRYMVRKESVPATSHERLVRCLQGFLHGDNINMRYLAAQMLIRVAGPLARDELLTAIQHENDPAALKLLRDSLIGFFTAQPSSYTATLIKRRHEPAAFAALYGMLIDMIWSGHDIVAQLPHLVSPEVVANDMVYMACCMDWLAVQVIQGRITLDQVLQAMSHAGSSDVVLSQLVLKLDLVPDLRLPVSTELLRQRMMVGSELERDAMIDLMGISRSASAVPVLVSVICDDRMHPFHHDAVRALARITQEGIA